MRDRTLPATHLELLHRYHRQYDDGLRAGAFEPFVYPWGAYGAFVAIIYLLIPHAHRPRLRRARFVVWAFTALSAAYAIAYTRCRNVAPAYGLGIVAAWTVVYSAAIMVVNDAQTDFRRIERTAGRVARADGSGESATVSKHTLSDGDAKNDGGLRQRVPDGTEFRKEETKDVTNLETKAGPCERHGSFAWQSYPLEPFTERLDWVLDLFTSFRGMGWNWRPSGLPLPPPSVQKELQENSGQPVDVKDVEIGYDGTRQYRTMKDLLRANLSTFLWGYLMLDLLKVVAMHDQYFWGLTDDPAPPSYFPEVIQSSPFLLRAYRLGFTLLAVKTALETIFAMGPLFFAGILGPTRIGARGEPWMYPDAWGSFRNVVHKGIAGWWGGWWHQTFRFAFAEPSRVLTAKLGMHPKSVPAKMLQLCTAFALSGFIHACGSYTAAGPTHPLSGAFAFFALQPLGIIAELTVSKLLEKAGVRQKIPQPIRRLCTVVYVYIWFYFTGPLLADDFARAGIWLFEPVPFSILRALGLGAAGDGWWCWGGRWFRVYHGRHWWMSGIAL